MDFGQTLDDRVLKNIDFSLPPLDSDPELAQLARLRRARNLAVARPAGAKPQIVRVGPPIWGEARWVGNIYPEGTKAAEFISAYQKQFKTVEINSTFYAVPARTTFAKWSTSVDKDFRFCPKFPKSVSHQIHSPNMTDLENFYAGLEAIRDNIGMTFLQLPGTFGAKMGDRNAKTLLKFLDTVPRWVKLGVEFRHPLFVENNLLKPDWVEALAERFAATVIIDTPLERQVCHTSLSAPRVMVRFLGANLHDTGWNRLDKWIERAAIWIEAGLQEFYFILHEPDIFYSPKSTQYFIRGLNSALQKHGLSLQLPEPFFMELL
ncbi:MAG: DUF72 domain-containing protein [Bdellovibrionales bacterium]|nr:DUF72 domain-containing protein [Bdellovibrionales bacterium]